MDDRGERVCSSQAAWENQRSDDDSPHAARCRRRRRRCCRRFHSMPLAIPSANVRCERSHERTAMMEFNKFLVSGHSQPASQPARGACAREHLTRTRASTSTFVSIFYASVCVRHATSYSGGIGRRRRRVENDAKPLCVFVYIITCTRALFKVMGITAQVTHSR